MHKCEWQVWPDETCCHWIELNWPPPPPPPYGCFYLTMINYDDDVCMMMIHLKDEKNGHIITVNVKSISFECIKMKLKWLKVHLCLFFSSFSWFNNNSNQLIIRPSWIQWIWTNERERKKTLSLLLLVWSIVLNGWWSRKWWRKTKYITITFIIK